MGKIEKHELGPSCDLCNEKAMTLCADIKPVWIAIKNKFPTAHISWAFRDQAMQDLFFSLNKTMVKWPNSKHNIMAAGIPAAEAFDLFEMREDYVARWHIDFFRSVWEFCRDSGLSVEWGGHWNRFTDNPHFQLSKKVTELSNSA
jgi:hypothetical protein